VRQAAAVQQVVICINFTLYRCTFCCAHLQQRATGTVVQGPAVQQHRVQVATMLKHGQSCRLLDALMG
jgi:transposase-like protein